MAHRKCKAIMGCTIQQPKKVIQRARSVLLGYYERTDLYPNHAVDAGIFENQLEKASSAQSCVQRGGLYETAKRDMEVAILFEMLKIKLLSQVNGLYEGDRVKLQASGFGVSKDPSPKSIPEKPYIKDIVNANTGLIYGAKIKLLRNTNPLDENVESYTYVVQMAKDRDGKNGWNNVLITKNQYKLIVLNLERGVEVFFRVARLNARGQSHWSDPMPFIPR